MFVWRQRPNRDRQTPPSSRHSSKLEDVLKWADVPEIKSYKKNINAHLNPRSLLIHSTQQLFRHETKPPTRIQQPRRLSHSHNSGRPSSRQSQREPILDLSRRESRVIAARRYREKIGKRGDITPLLRAQDELALSRHTEYLHMSHNEPYQRVQRYRDMLKQFASEVTGDKKQLIKSYWIAGMSKSTATRKMSTSSKNPELPVTNIEFNDMEEPSSSWVRERRRQWLKKPHVGYSSQGKRSSRANPGSLFQEENYIEPW